MGLQVGVLKVDLTGRETGEQRFEYINHIDAEEGCSWQREQPVQRL